MLAHYRLWDWFVRAVEGKEVQADRLYRAKRQALFLNGVPFIHEIRMNLGGDHLYSINVFWGHWSIHIRSHPNGGSSDAASDCNHPGVNFAQQSTLD